MTSRPFVKESIGNLLPGFMAGAPWQGDYLPQVRRRLLDIGVTHDGNSTINAMALGGLGTLMCYTVRVTLHP